MKALLLKLTSLVLMIYSLNLSAVTILLQTRPVILIANGSDYRFPRNYAPINSYHYVIIANERRVCFINQQPQLSGLDLLRVSIDDQFGKRYLWFCYRYDPRYFTIDF